VFLLIELHSLFSFLCLSQNSILALEEVRTNHGCAHEPFQEGKWIIRATGSSGTAQDYEEYIVDFKNISVDHGAVIGLNGTGFGTTGKSKNGLVSIIGTVKGSSLTFVEEWSDGSEDGVNNSSTCVVSGRLSLDGNSFEGTYRNVQFGTAGQIAGIRNKSRHVIALQPKDAPSLSLQGTNHGSSILACEAILCLAVSHLCTILGEDPARDLEDLVESTGSARSQALNHALSGSLISSAALVSSDSSIEEEKGCIAALYAPPIPSNEVSGISLNESMDLISLEESPEVFSESSDDSKEVTQLENKFSTQSKRSGSFHCLCQDEYHAAQRSIAIVLFKILRSKSSDSEDEDKLLPSIWNGALQVVEAGLRKVLSKTGDHSKKQLCIETCSMFCILSSFLAELDWSVKTL